MAHEDERSPDIADAGAGPAALAPVALYRVCDPESLGFDTTAELTDGERWVGQERLTSSIRFGLGMRAGEYHIFALGPRGTDKRTPVEELLREHSLERPVPPDLCYVRNFDDPYCPTLLSLPAGRGGELSRAMDEFADELEPALIAAFESDEYQSRRQALQEGAREEQGRELEQLQERAKEKGLALIRTPAGFGFLPRGEDGDVMDEEEIRALSDEEKAGFEERSGDLQSELQGIVRALPARQRKIHAQIRTLDREIASFALKELIEGIRERFEGQDQVTRFLDAVEADIVENVQAILQASSQGGQGGQGGVGGDSGHPSLQSDDEEGGPPSAGVGSPVLSRYRVNLFVDNSEVDGAPVVYEEHPTFKNLIGRIEHRARMGALTTDFSLIRPGALHRANGGTLVMDARSVLLEPFTWEALKRVLTTGRLKIESLGQSYTMVSTVGLEPEPLELDVKIVLLGERMIYYLLCANDPEFGSLFRVQADFEDEMEWNGETDGDYARFLAGLIHDRKLRPFDRSAVARVIEEAARFAGDRERLSTRTREIEDLLQEADYWAGDAGSDTVRRDDVERAIEQQVYRASRVRDRVREQILRETVLIDTEGSAVGQINGLSVMQLGNLAFGSPTRITARVGLGKGEIVDIEREVDMGGPLHSKGVLILKGLLAERYARDRPLSLAASLVFEQQYGGVDGDSASTAELLALLSAIGGVPLRQSFAVTGSVNQHGRVQAIGGVNEKIEGFFDICSERGLTGDQGVVIPDANAKHLMLRPRVVEAVRRGEFGIHAVRTVDDAAELLSGIPAGERTVEGLYPEGSFNGRVAAELERMAERLRRFAIPGAAVEGVEVPDRTEGSDGSDGSREATGGDNGDGPDGR